MRSVLLAVVLLTPALARAADDGLDEVNAARARRGLPAFVRDDALTAAAATLADFRAAHRIEGHTKNDFTALPKGASASATGCGAGKPSWGWLTCCTYDAYRTAGAAWAWGADGQRYMHLVVRDPTAPPTSPPPPPVR